MISVCVDSVFLFALYDPTDTYHDGAPELFAKWFEDIPSTLVAPWPILYETLNTKFVRRKALLEEMERHISLLRARNQLEMIDDSPYRDPEFEATLSAVRQLPYRPLSLVDRVLRKMIADSDLRIDALFSLNVEDFYDVCQRVGCDIIEWPE